MRVHFYTKYARKGASSRYRTYQYQDRFREAGLETKIFPLFSDLYLETLYTPGAPKIPAHVLYRRRWEDMQGTGNCDLAVVEKELLPYLPSAFEKKPFRRARKLLLDFDDAIYLKYRSLDSLLPRLLLRHKIDRLMEWSDGAIGGNRALVEYAALHAPRTWTVPTTVEVSKYSAHDHDHEGLVTIGWIGTPMTVHYLREVRDALQSVAREISLRFVVIGAPAPGWEGVEARSQPWSEEREAELVRWLDVGLMPLPDAPWERCKCGLKILQYMAAEVVPVASDVGTNRDIVEDGVDGFLCKTPADWAGRILDLSQDPELRARMGKAARKKVEERYSRDDWAGKLIDIYREVAGK